MAHSGHFAAVDLGATSGRVMLAGFDSERVSLTEIHRFPNEPVSYHGGLHWDMPRLWLEVCRGLESAVQGSAAPITSVGVDAWGVDYGLLGENGELLGNPYHYRDSRTDGVLEQVLREIPAADLYGMTGIQFMQFNTLFQLYAARQRTPRLLSTAATLLTIPDLVNYWLTGIPACEYSIASTTQMLDWRTRRWNSALLENLGIPSHLLAPIIEPGTILGRFQGMQVVAPACHDTASAVAAIDTAAGAAFLSSGTWSLLGAEVPRPVVTPEAHQLNFTNEGGVCGTIRLLKNITGLWLLEGCRRVWDRENGPTGFDQLLAEATASPGFQHSLDPDDPAFLHPENMTVAMADYCRRTDQAAPQSKGAFVRAIFESLARKYAAVLGQLEQITGCRYAQVRVVGGGSRIGLLNQLIADASGRTVIAGPAEATALGNVAIQMLATGAVDSLAEARAIIDRSFPPGTYRPSTG